MLFWWPPFGPLGARVKSKSVALAAKETYKYQKETSWAVRLLVRFKSKSMSPAAKETENRQKRPTTRPANEVQEQVDVSSCASPERTGKPPAPCVCVCVCVCVSPQ